MTRLEDFRNFRVAFVDQTGGKSSGAQESLLLLLQALPSSIDKVIVVFQTGSYEQRLRSLGYETVIFPLGSSLETASRFSANPVPTLWSASDIIRFSKMLRQIRPTLVHTNTVKAHLVGLLAARLIGVPGVMHLRDALGGSGRMALRALGRYVATRSISVSHRIANHYAIATSDVIYNAIDTSRYNNLLSKRDARTRLGLPQGVPIVGIVGPIHQGKGHDRFLRALLCVAERRPVIGAIVGEARFGGAEGERLRAMTRKLGLADRVRFVPWLDDPRPALSALDVLCNCSTLEPFGRTIGEAAACGVPSVIFSDSGISEIFVNGISASIVRAHDEAEFASHLCNLLDKPEKLNAMGEAAKVAVRSLRPDRHADEVMQTYAIALKSECRETRAQ